MGFDASKVIEPLDWNFEKYDAGSGTVPEPSEKDVEKLFRDIAAATSKLTERFGEDVSVDDLLVQLSDLPEGESLGFAAMIEALTKAFAGLCKGQPSKAQLNRLPMRVKLAFFAWLTRELRPEAPNSASPNPGPASGVPDLSAFRSSRPA